MKNYFIRLFEYDKYANQKILETIREADNPEKPVQLMAHLLAAQQRWLNRCKNASVIENDLWPQKEATPFEELIAFNNQKWISFLSSLAPSGMEQTISYKNSAGTAYTDILIDILTHLINHGTHHRAQIGQQLKFAGTERLPGTDYILFVRN